MSRIAGHVTRMTSVYTEMVTRRVADKGLDTSMASACVSGLYAVRSPRRQADCYRMQTEMKKHGAITAINNVLCFNELSDQRPVL